MISGRTRSAYPNSMGPQFQISGANELGSKTNPDVGGDPDATAPTYYCVVWENQWNDDGDIHARRVATNGVPFGDTFALDSSFGDDTRPRISESCGMYPWGTQRWTVVWMRYQSTLNYDIYGSQISWSGVVTAPTFPIDTTGSNDRWPTVSSILDGGEGPSGSGHRPYLVAWYDGADISGKVLQGTTELTPRTNLTALEGPNQANAQLSPCVESDGSTFVMAYAEAPPGEGYDIYVAEFDYAGGQIFCTDPHRLAAGSTPMEMNPLLASRRSGGGPPGGFMAVWQQINGPSEADTEGAILTSLGFGHTYCATNFNTTGEAAHLRIVGSRSIANGSMALIAEDCPPSKPGLFFLGPNQVNSAFGEGRRCVGGSVKRLPLTSTNSQGVAARMLDFNAPYASGIFAGPGGVNYQYWFRDPAGGPAGFNLTDGLHVEHTP